MIKVIDNKFIRVDTKNNTLAFYIIGELPEIVYYGKKLKKDIEILKKAVNIDVKNININPNEEIDESSIGLDNINEIDIRFIDDTKVKEEYTISGQESLSEDFSKEKKEDI